MSACQNCFVATKRRCSRCKVCIYCSENCEQIACTTCNASLACKLHQTLKREETNLGEVAMHVRMFPSMVANLSAKDEWDQI